MGATYNPYPVTQVYYKTSDGKLRQINAATSDHELAIFAVENQIKMEKQQVVSPVLALIIGGKA